MLSDGEGLEARDLQATKLSPEYRRELVRGWNALLYFLASSSSSINWKSVSFESANNILVRFVQEKYAEMGAKGFRPAKHSLLAVQTFFPRFKGKLRLAWESLKSWDMEMPVSMRCAVPLPVL